ncbi:MAG: EthD domain-containing protein, partial [Thaumarchaeota archaeon]|nr:EthD domain-containing protein [Candidatus Geocrenenecus arthurdayi]
FCMIRVVQELKKKPEVSVEEFQGFILKNYARFLKKLAGLRSASVKFVYGGYQVEELPVDCCIEMEFRNEDIFKKAVESEEARKILEEMNKLAEKSVFLYLREKAVKKPQAKQAKKRVKKK